MSEGVLIYLFKGLLIGLIFGVPAGAVGALTIQRTLAHGFPSGFVTGTGSSAADLLYAVIGVFGISIVSDFLLEHQVVISLVGGALIMALGALIFRKKGAAAPVPSGHARLPGFFCSSFAIAVTNPATLLSFFLAFSTFQIAGNPTFLQGLLLILGILAGTCCWWGGLSAAVARFRNRVTDRIYLRLNRLLGSLMLLFGLAAVIRVWIP